jgi:hypothetical protein
MSLCVVETLHGREVADETARYIEFHRRAVDMDLALIPTDRAPTSLSK